MRRGFTTKAPYRDDLAGYRADMALRHAMQSAHTSLDGALLRVLEILGEEKPAGERRHADLVKRVRWASWDGRGLRS